MNILIREIETIVEAACARETNTFGYGIWTHHITKVADNAVRLAGLFEADKEIVEIAALLHDYASVKDSALYEQHHIHSARQAEAILKKLGYSQEKIEAVKHCIQTHRASLASERRTPEAECLANADAFTHIQQVPSLLHLAFVEHGLGIDEGAQWVQRKLERSWDKLSPKVQALVEERYRVAQEILAAKCNLVVEGYDKTLDPDSIQEN